MKHVNPSLVDGFEMETATPNALAIAAEESSAPAGAPPPAFPQLKRRGKGKEKAEPEDEPAEEEIPSPPPPDFGGDQNDASDERCFDCDQPILAYNSWMSATYGITLCLECAGVHRGFGVQTSFVRSLALDTLTAREARTLHILNGNEGFGKFLADPSRGVPRRVWLALPLQTRYHTPAADLFRRKMKAALDEEELGEPHLAVQLPVTADDAGAGSIVEGAGGPTAKNCGELAMDTAVRPPPPLKGAAQSPSGGGSGPQWTRDRDAPKCELCKADFHLLNWRHHCRKCGRCVCSECSPTASWRPLPEILGTAETVRHCKLCVAPTRPMVGM